jgi:hypothetical protein
MRNIKRALKNAILVDADCVEILYFIESHNRSAVMPDDRVANPRIAARIQGYCTYRMHPYWADSSIALHLFVCFKTRKEHALA